MGRFTYETFDPEELGLPNDVDFELEGIDEAYESYQEYRAYLPDRISELRPLGRAALDACAAAEEALARMKACMSQRSPQVAHAVAQLLLYQEAVATTQAESYQVSCASMLDYHAASLAGGSLRRREAEEAALDAVEGLRAFAVGSCSSTSVEDICSANELFARTSARAEVCGSLRERPVFIGHSLFDADYVAPPADSLEDYLDDLVGFANDEDCGFGPVARAAIAQLQLVVVHPFEDGNGRTSRALSQRLLRMSGVTGGLVLPVTAVMLAQCPDYVDAIQQVCDGTGPSDASAFVRAFAACCAGAAGQAVALAERVDKVLVTWQGLLDACNPAIARALDAFVATPLMSEPMLSAKLAMPAGPILTSLLAAGVIERRRSAFCDVDVYQVTGLLS